MSVLGTAWASARGLNGVFGVPPVADIKPVPRTAGWCTLLFRTDAQEQTIGVGSAKGAVKVDIIRTSAPWKKSSWGIYCKYKRKGTVPFG